MDLPLAAQGTVVLNGKPVSLVLNPGNQLKALAVSINGNFFILEIQSSGAVLVVLYHTAYRNGKLQFVQHRQGNVYLSSSTVHHNQIREPGKTAIHISRIFTLPLLLLVHAVDKPPGQHLFHAGIIIGTFHGLNPELPVITALGFSLLVNHHGAHGLKTADVGNIKSLYPVDAPHV